MAICRTLIALASLVVWTSVCHAQVVSDAPGTTAPPAGTAETVSEVPAVVAKYSARAIKKWEADIAKLESLDTAEQHPEDSILFIGSSSVRLWKTIEEDMAPFHPIRRGYGGAKYKDLALFSQRLISPHQCRAIVMFVANDVTEKGDDPDTPFPDLEELVRHIVATANDAAPGKPMFIVEITPTRKRWKVWDKTRDANRVLREVCQTTPNVFFIETAETFLTDDKQPRDDLFVDDQLHLNESGYDLWATRIKTELQTHFDSVSRAQDAEPSPVEATDE